MKDSPALFKHLFCSHNYKVISEHVETYQEEMTERVGGPEFGYFRTIVDFWGQPIIRKRTRKTVLLKCSKCGKTKTEVL